jgi:hypothetical protein
MFTNFTLGILHFSLETQGIVLPNDLNDNHSFEKKSEKSNTIFFLFR